MFREKCRSRLLICKTAISRLCTRAILILTLILIWMSISYASQPPAQKQTIVDLGALMHIASVGNLKQNDIYTVAGEQEMCLVFTNGTSGMWNLERNKLSVAPGPLCPLPDGARQLIRNAPIVGEGSPPPVALKSPVLYHVYDPSIDANCGSIIGDYYVMYYPDGHSYSFYLIGRLSKPGIFIKADICDYMMGTTETAHLVWSGYTFASYVALSGNRGILYDSNWGQQFVRSMFLMIPPTLGDQVISIDHLIYIIPANRLRPLLDKAGFDPVARNQALQHFIQTLPAGEIDIP